MNKKEERKKQILRAAFKAVAKKGFDYVTLQDIADHACISKGVTNYYFKNKEDVLSHLLIWLTEKIHKNERDAINNETGALNKLNSYVNAAFASPEENKTFYKVYLDFLAQANKNERYKTINFNFYKNCWALGKEIVAEGQKENVFSKGINKEKAAITIRALIDGSLIQWMMRNDDTLHCFYKNNCYETLYHYLKKLRTDNIERS